VHGNFSQVSNCCLYYIVSSAIVKPIKYSILIFFLGMVFAVSSLAWYLQHPPFGGVGRLAASPPFGGGGSKRGGRLFESSPPQQQTTTIMTGFEPALSGVTGRRINQLCYMTKPIANRAKRQTWIPKMIERFRSLPGQ